MPLYLHYLLFAIFPFVLAYAAASDLLTMTIPNRLSLILIAGFVALAPLTGMDLTTFALHLAAGGAMLALTFFLFAMGWIGGGDAKLAAVVALWMGWNEYMIQFAGLASIFGGVLTLAILLYRNTMAPAMVNLPPWASRLYDPQTGIPYGIALAAGALMVYPHTIWLRLATG